jgi:stalled ribosome rescue protein Dom34
MHNKEQQMHESYYKEIADKILNYDHILLFGPTNAKNELYNFLMEDLHFEEIEIDVEATDKMFENERKAFVINFYKNKFKKKGME